MEFTCGDRIWLCSCRIKNTTVASLELPSDDRRLIANQAAIHFSVHESVDISTNCSITKLICLQKRLVSGLI